MVRFAVTGGIASGKSLVGSFLREAGVAVCEADELAHEVMRPGGEAYEEVVRSFGGSILGGNGEIDREKLGAVVFGDEDSRKRLNAATHPVVAMRWGKWLEARETEGTAVAAVIVPLLHESGLAQGWDGVVCVVSPPALRMKRLMKRGIGEADAHARIGAQWSDSRKAELSDYVIENDGGIELLRERTLEVLGSILKRQGQG